jgi:putative transposase
MIDRCHALPLARQAAELGISRGSLYYQPQAVSAADLALMRRMDELHLEYPLRAAGCCATCCWRRAFRSGVCMSPR